MQGQRSIFDPFPEIVDLNSNSNSTSMDESDDWNMLSPIERRLLNNNNNNNLRSFSNWDVGESSSRATLQDHHHQENGLKIESNWAHDSQLESSSSPTIVHPHNNNNSSTNVLNSVSSNLNVNLNVGYDDDEDEDEDDDGIGFMDLYKSGTSGPHTEATGSSTSDCGPGAWGLSCKRKALEGGSGSSSCFPQNHSSSSSSRSLNISSSNLANPVLPPPAVGPTTNTRVLPESSRFAIRGSSNVGPTASRLLPNIIGGSSSHNNQLLSSNRQILLNEFLDQTSRTQMNHPNQGPPPLMHHVPNLPRNPNFPWGSSSNTTNNTNNNNNNHINIGSRNGSRNPNLGSRNNLQFHNFVPSNLETRNLVQDPTNWSLATGSGGAPSGSRNGSRSFNAVWTPQHVATSSTPSQQRVSDFPPWTLFPSSETESGSQRSSFSPFFAGSSSSTSSSSNSEDNHGVPHHHHNHHHHHQAFSRSSLLMEVPNDDWRALAADIEGRQRLVSEIRQVLNAMRRGENLRAEDYMLFDPFINGVAELHDRHRDMRLDVDNMSYEELLALEERIGDVNTGLSEEVILKSMKQRKHIAFMAISTQNLEPCCICQEEYDSGDNIGRLDCGHDFHTDCIKKWLEQKNICPICKMTGLAT